MRVITLGTLNMCDSNIAEKKNMNIDIFKERKMDVLTLCKTKVRGEGKF